MWITPPFSWNDPNARRAKIPPSDERSVEEAQVEPCESVHGDEDQAPPPPRSSGDD